MGCDVGYGMTETCGMCAILAPELVQLSPSSVGLPVPSIEIKLVDVPDAGYSSSHSPPTGEILIRGPSVVKGYYKREELNPGGKESSWTEDGWFKTGDVGMWNKDGTLSIIDRYVYLSSHRFWRINCIYSSIKNLIKLSNGEYIAVERLEAVYKSSPFVSNICVYAHSEAKVAIAIISPNEAKLRSALSTSPNPPSQETHLHDLCQTEEARKQVLDSCLETGKSHGLRGTELLGAVVLVDEEWTVESGYVSAAMKIQRTKIVKRWDGEIKVSFFFLEGLRWVG